MKTKFKRVVILMVSMFLSLTAMAQNVVLHPDIVSTSNKAALIHSATLKVLVSMVFVIFVFNILRYYLSEYSPADDTEDEKPKRLVKKGPIVDINKITIDTDGEKYSFLNVLPIMSKEIKDINAVNKRIKKSDMSTIHKARANEIMMLTDKVVDTMRSMHSLGRLTAKDEVMAVSKLSEFKSGLSSLIEKKADHLFSELDNIKMPDTYDKEDELEQLKIQGITLLDAVKKDPVFDTSENRYVLDKVVNERLDEVWQGYIAAKRVYNDGNISGELNPDVVIDDIFSEIRRMYSDMNNDFHVGRQSSTISNLLANKNYFKQR